MAEPGERSAQNFDAPARAAAPEAFGEVSARTGFAPVDHDPFAPVQPAAPAAQILGCLPLTAPQRELYAASQMGPQAHGAFILCHLLHLEGPVSAEVMREAWGHVVARHAALRAAVTPDGQGQWVAAALPLPDLPSISLPGLDRAAREQALAELVAEEVHTPFDLSVPPLWRARLVSWDDQHHTLVLALHHLVADGWSTTVWMQDLGLAYAAAAFGTLPAWPGDPMPYERWIQQLESPAERARAEADEAYWAARHNPPATPWALPVDRPRPPIKTFDAHLQRATVGPVLTQALRQLGARHGCTLFVTLLATCMGWLARLSGAHDGTLGIPVAAQPDLAEGDVVGDGAYALPLRVAVDPERPFALALGDVRAQFAAAREHPRCSFGNLVRRLGLRLDPSRTPLVDVLFNLDRLQLPGDFGPLRLAGWESPRPLSNAELSVNVLDDGHDLVIEVLALSALYDPSTIQRWLAIWVQALQTLVESPQTPWTAAFAPAQAEAALLTRFNATDVPFAAAVPAQAAFERQAQLQPQALAVRCGEDELTYGELDALANGVALALQQAGVGAGARVGLAGTRSVRLLAGLVGILKSGAAFVPLDPAYPAARLALMAEDAGLQALVCDAQGDAALPSAHAATRIRVESVAASASRPAPVAGGHAPAYVIYTSGSTGRPKGVVVTHRNLTNLLTGAAAAFERLGPGDLWAAVTSLSFDISLLDIWLPLSRGAALLFSPTSGAQDGPGLAAWLQAHRPSWMQAVPAVWRLLLQAGWQGDAGRLSVVSGGEALSSDLASALLPRCAALYNAYGPTETTIYSSIDRVAAGEPWITVGRPIANTQFQVLDAQGRLLPIGVVGEIWIAGEGVAAGYLGREDLTALGFQADPMRAGGRRYRTGDLGCWMPDGRLRCLGRADHQVKLRGFRIEPGEVEAALRALPGIADAVVQLRPGLGGDDELVAHVVMQPAPTAPGGVASGADWPLAGALDARALREALRQTLPAHLVPARIGSLPALPRLPNGKLDRSALPDAPAWQPVAGPAEQPRAAALDARQAQVAAIWASLLGVDDVRADDNFFDLGGHSLLAARAVLRMRDELGLTVTVPRLIAESLAQLASSGRGSAGEPPPDAARPEAARGWRAWLQRRGMLRSPPSQQPQPQPSAGHPGSPE
jgi:amino acid adenylation domain-containing protein